MKLITLNTWGGRMDDLNESFFGKYKDVDIWCLQEVHNGSPEDNGVKFEQKPNREGYSTYTGFLKTHQSEFCQVLDNYYGIASFIHKNIKIVERGEILVARGNWDVEPRTDDTDHHRKLQWIEVSIDGKKAIIANTHLTHRPEGKGDSEKRINQSKVITQFLKMFDCPKILCGDFNLMPDTESIRKIEEAGMRNLIKEYGVTSTRTELYKKVWRYADYIFVSPGITVNDFKVLPDIVSDHSPLYLDFEIE